MSRTKVVFALVVLAALASAGVVAGLLTTGGATSTAGAAAAEPQEQTRTFTNVVTYIPDVVTVTVTEPAATTSPPPTTTTAPPTTTTAAPPPPPPSGSGDVFLSPAGLDANPCTQTAPCRNLDRGYRVARPGQVVELAAGNYAGGTIQVDSSKTFTADVIFRPAGAVTITNELLVRGSHITLENMTIPGWKTYASTDDVTFRNVVTRHFFIWSSSNITILGGEVRSPTGTTTYDSQITEFSGSGVSPTNILIDGVHFHDFVDVDPGQSNHIECLQVGAGINVTIRNSRFERCGTHDIFIRSWGGINGGTHTLRNWLIENNFFGKTTDGFYAIQFVNDLGFTNADLLLRHNSFLQGIVSDDPSTTVTVDSNIFSEQASWGCNADTYRHNIYETLQGTGGPCGTTDRVARVQYVNRAALNLHLAPGSAGIDEGNPESTLVTDIDGDARPCGGRADAGADETGC